MGESKIEWTERTWNPVRGCVKVSPGCAHCYASTFAERWRGVPGHPYEQGFDLRLVPHKLDEPRLRKEPTTYFVNSMSDLFQEGVPWSYVEQVFDVMRATPQHTYQVLTKRSTEMMLFAANWAFHHDGPLPNVRLGVSVENQRFAYERFPHLVAIGRDGWLTMVSMEPLLGSTVVPAEYLALGAKGWIIVGGESGPGARPFDTTFARAIVKQCVEAGVPVFVKQLGAKPEQPSPGAWNSAHRESIPLRDKKGGDMAEWPEDLRVRQFPAPQVTR